MDITKAINPVYTLITTFFPDKKKRLENHNALKLFIEKELESSDPTIIVSGFYALTGSMLTPEQIKFICSFQSFEVLKRFEFTRKFVAIIKDPSSNSYFLDYIDEYRDSKVRKSKRNKAALRFTFFFGIALILIAFVLPLQVLGTKLIVFSLYTIFAGWFAFNEAITNERITKTQELIDLTNKLRTEKNLVIQKLDVPNDQ